MMVKKICSLCKSEKLVCQGCGTTTLPLLHHQSFLVLSGQFNMSPPVGYNLSATLSNMGGLSFPIGWNNAAFTLIANIPLVSQDCICDSPQSYRQMIEVTLLFQMTLL
jgi:hypothetical protein